MPGLQLCGAALMLRLPHARPLASATVRMHVHAHATPRLPPNTHTHPPTHTPMHPRTQHHTHPCTHTRAPDSNAAFNPAWNAGCLGASLADLVSGPITLAFVSNYMYEWGDFFPLACCPGLLRAQQVRAGGGVRRAAWVSARCVLGCWRARGLALTLALTCQRPVDWRAALERTALTTHARAHTRTHVHGPRAGGVCGGRGAAQQGPRWQRLAGAPRAHTAPGGGRVCRRRGAPGWVLAGGFGSVCVCVCVCRRV
jgi:hypothetical protein